MPPKRKRAAKSSKRVKKSRSKDARSFLDSEAAEESGYVSSCDHSKYVGSKLSKITIDDCSTLSYFLYCGKKWVAISSLKYGNERFDRNLEKVRLDVFGNVMILDAPHWSDISAQFTHGFPRRLIPYHHRGILSGNITVAARISNQAIRSLSTGN